MSEARRLRSGGQLGFLSWSVRLPWFAFLGVAIVLVLAACGSSSASSSQTTPSASVVKARPAGVSPSKSARMVCGSEAQNDIAMGLGVTATAVTSPTWNDHVYSCQYVYPNGALSLSVKELDSMGQTKRYFARLGDQLRRGPGKIFIGEDAFITANGSLVLRKDQKVLLVDVSKLPAKFGRPSVGHKDAAIAVATAIMGCWTGA